MSDNTPGWQPDPTGHHDHRYWDGSQWTDNISDAGVAGTDAYIPAATDGGELGGPDDPTVADTPAVSASEMPAPAPLDPTIGSGPRPPDATAAWPVTPGAPGAPAPPPPYVPTGPAGPSDGGSKKGLLIGGGILAVVVLAVIAILALGGDDDSGRERASNDADTTTTESDPDEDGGDSGGQTDGLTDTGELPADFEDILADTYEETLGLSREKAECLAGSLSEDIQSGALDEEEAMGAFMEYLSDCDISLEEIGGN